MSDSNRVSVRYLEESTWGTTPSSAMTELRVTSEGLTYGIETAISDEIRSDRQVTDIIRTGFSPAGDVGWELSYGTLDSLMRAALYSADWIGVGGTTTESITSGATASNLDFSLDSTGNTITFGSAVTIDIEEGQWIKLTGSTADDGYHQVTGVSGQEITVASITTTEVLDEVDAATVKGARVRNGTTETSFTIEKEFEDVTSGDSFQYFTGMVPNAFSMSMAADSIITGSFGFMGKDSDTASATQGTGAPNAANSNEVMATPTDVSSVMEAGSEMTGVFVQTLSFDVNNNVRGITAVGAQGNADLGVGRFEVTGSLNVYLSTMDLYTKFKDGTSTSLSARVEDTAGNAYVLTFPNVEFSDGSMTAGGANSDVMLDLSWTGIRDDTYGFTMQVDRFAA